MSTERGRATTGKERDGKGCFPEGEKATASRHLETKVMLAFFLASFLAFIPPSRSLRSQSLVHVTGSTLTGSNRLPRESKPIREAYKPVGQWVRRSRGAPSLTILARPHPCSASGVPCVAACRPPGWLAWLGKKRTHTPDHSTCPAA